MPENTPAIFLYAGMPRGAAGKVYTMEPFFHARKFGQSQGANDLTASLRMIHLNNNQFRIEITTALFTLLYVVNEHA